MQEKEREREREKERQREPRGEKDNVSICAHAKYSRRVATLLKAFLRN